MSGKTIDPKVALRRLLVRSGLVAAYFLLIGVAFVLGKGHTLLVDNKDAKDGSFLAADGILVSVDGKEALELYKGDRELVVVQGQRHSVTLEPVSGGGKITRSLRLPMDGDMLLLSVPRLVADREPFFEPFIQKDQPRPVGEETGDSNAFTSPDAEVVPAAPAP